jgi:hypothetical protein
VTAFVDETVEITWTAPFNGGQAITAYQILIQQSDMTTFTESVLYCDGTKLTVVNTRICTIPLNVLIAQPFNLPWGASVWAKVKAVNIIGESTFSEPGNGSIILVVPG